MAPSSRSVKKVEDILHRMTDRIRRSLELPEILEATVDEMRQFLKVDRVKIYQFHEDNSGEVVAESVDEQRLPSLLGQKFPAEDIPEKARKTFLALRQRSIVNVSTGKIGTSPLIPLAKDCVVASEIYSRPVDPCHAQYLTGMGVNSSLVVPILCQHRLWGLLVAHHSVSRHFGKKELEVVQLVADQVIVAISHANLLKLTRQQGQHEVIVNQTVSHLHSTAKDPLQSTLSYVVKALQCAGGRLYIPANSSAYPRKIVTEGIQPSPSKISSEVFSKASTDTSLTYDSQKNNKIPVLEQLPLWQSWLSTEAITQPVANLWSISDIRSGALPETLSEALLNSRIRSLLIVKLVHQNSFIGYLSLFRQSVDIERVWAGKLDALDPRQQGPRKSFEAWREIKKDQANPWASREISILQDIAEQTASAIYQTQLYQEVQALNTNLEERVSQRTAELQRLNKSLTKEIVQREKALAELQKVRDSLKRLGYQNKLILESAGEGIYGIDLGGRVVFVNPAAAKMLGYKRQSLVGAFMQDLVQHTQPDGIAYVWDKTPICNTLERGKTHHVSGDIFKRKDGFTFPIEYVSTPIWEKGQIIGAVVVFKDITDRQIIESMKDEFVAVVSHELRTPLTSIKAALGLLSQKNLHISIPKQQRMINIASSNANRLVRLVDDILDVEQIKLGKITLKKQFCELSVLVEQATDEMNAMAEDNGIILASKASEVMLQIDRDRIVQTLTNLLNNAIKFSPSGSIIEISAQRVNADNSNWVKAELNLIGKAAIDATLDSAKEIVLVAVKDRGRGIPSNKLEAVFNQFEQLNKGDSEHKGGTGLGLAICRSIVQQHRGKIWAQSEVGKGSTFFFTLPASCSDTLSAIERGEQYGESS